jgi:hypothetical protein
MAIPFTKEGQYQQEYFGETMDGLAPATPGPEPPSSGDSPGPVSTPNEGQNGTPPQPQNSNPPPRPTPPPPPPAIASTIEGVEGSSETGGVRGSFGQAGTRGFQRRFGGEGPAQWYRRTLSQMSPGVARQARARAASRGGGISGGVGQSTPQPIVGGVEGDVGGKQGDADMQRLMAEALRRMFGSRGGA